MQIQKMLLPTCFSVVFGLATLMPNSMLAGPVHHGLNIYLVDVEGGGATLFVTPAGQSVLIDGGWRTKDQRDSKRIRAVMQMAGLDHLDYVIVSHYHSDHLGGVVELAKRVKVAQFLDRGLMEKTPPYVSRELYLDYLDVAKGRRRAVHLGEQIKLKAVAGGPTPEIEIVSADGKTITNAYGKENPACTGAKPTVEDTGENSNSLAMLLKFGSFRYFDGADLTWEKEGKLVCPVNQIGKVNVYQVDHHGKGTSNNPDLIASLDPQAAIMNNGSDKGGDPEVFATLRRTLKSDDIYAIHRNLHSDPASNAEKENLANPDASDGGFGFEVRVDADGSKYEVVNERTQKQHTYLTRSLN